MSIAILAHPRDAAAARLAQAWRDRGACLVQPRDLSRPGWRLYVGGRGEEWFVADGERRRASTLRGVVNRLPVIEAEGLTHLHEGDRGYAAVEMTAFLVAWLSRLRCPVLSRPHPGSLLGPPLGETHLAFLVERAGLRPPASRTRTRAPSGAATRVAVVGDEVVGAAASWHGAAARRLARTAGAALMTVAFDGDDDGARIVAADLLVDTDDPSVAQALARAIDQGQQP